MKNEEYRQRICHECNLYMDICNGRRLYKLPLRGKACVNRVQSTENTKSTIQVLGFMSLYKTKRRSGDSLLESFVGAILATSDDVFEKCKKENAELIENFQRKT